MHLNITGSVTLSQIFVRGVRGSTDSLVLFGIEWSSSSDLLADFENDSLGDTLMCSIIEPQDSILPADSSSLYCHRF